MVKIYTVLLFLLLLGCSKKGKIKNASIKVNSKVMNSKDSLSIQQLTFLTKAKAIEKYGNPSSQEQFILNDSHGEFRIGLYNIYTTEQRRSEIILIDELTWEKDKNTWITVWYEIKKENSEPKDVYLWKKGTEF